MKLRRALVIFTPAIVILVAASPVVVRLYQEKRARDLDLELSKQTYLVGELCRRIKALSASGEPLPDSPEVFRAVLEREMPQVVRDDDRAARVLKRALIIKDVTDTLPYERHSYRWMVIVWIGKFGGMQDDIVCFGGAFQRSVDDQPRFDSRTTLNATAARSQLGNDPVEAARKRYLEDANW